MGKVINMLEWLNKKRLEGKYKGNRPISVKEKIRIALAKWGSFSNKARTDKDKGKL